MGPVSRIIAAFVLIRVVLLAARIGLLFTTPWYSDFLHYFLLARQADQGLLPFIQLLDGISAHLPVAIHRRISA